MKKTKPNIVFIHTDQQHFEALSAYGNPWLKTPHMDRLVNEGYSFMKMHTVMPMCCPARASWMTGRTSKETGVPINGTPLNPDIPDLAQWLREYTDYETVHTGKWHVPNRNVRESFDKVLIAEGPWFGEQTDPEVARSAVSWILNRQSVSPYFMSIGLLNPHDCCYTAGAAGGLGKFLLSGVLQDECPPLPANFLSDGHPAFAVRTRGWNENDWRYYIYCYYRMVEMVDEHIGMICEAIRRSKNADNTIIIFTSDHGDGLAFHGKLEKGFLEDQAWRVPAIISWPGRISGGVKDYRNLASVLDIPATICDFAEAPRLPFTDTMLSSSWRPLLERGKISWREYVIGETNTAVAFRDNFNTKTIFYNTGQVDVYNTELDQLEMNNLRGTPAGNEILRRHRGWFRDYLNRINPSPLPEWGRVPPNRANLYPTYLDWYDKMKKELNDE